MIKSFRNRQTKEIFERNLSGKLPTQIHRIALRKLLILHAAPNLRSLYIPPSNHLEELKGKRKGQMSIRINDQWRICFEWNNGDAFNVEIVDCH